jgi:GntR family transcriptional regulator
MKRESVRVDPRSPVPIWSQIEEGLRRLMAQGALGLGAPVPSVREMARELRVNPATVSKAYQRLCDEGVLEVRRGEGTYVAQVPPGLPRAERQRTLGEGARRYASLSLTIGATREEAEDELRSVWTSLHARPRGEER